MLDRLKQWLKSGPKSVAPAILTVHDFHFHSEQDGPPERELKAKWSKIMQAHPEVRRAYLAQASFDQMPGRNVVLCVSSTKGEDARLVTELVEPFRLAFRTDAHLDVAFLTANQETNVRSVCAPFYEAAA